MTDIAIAAARAIALVRTFTEEDFFDDDVRQLAIVHLIQDIGEAASRLSGAFRAEHPEVPWNDVIGMRNRIVHEYGSVSLVIVWQTANEDLPVLLRQIQHWLPPGAVRESED